MTMVSTGKAAFDIVCGPPLPVGEKRFYTDGRVTSDWIDSADGKLSLRISTWIVSADGPFTVLADLRNNTKEPIAVIKPFGDRYHAACSIEIDGPKGRCGYIGPTPSYVLGKDAFATIPPGEILSDRAEFHFENYRNCGEKGNYRLRFRYTYEGSSDSVLRGEFGPVWQGEIVSPEIRTQVGYDGRVYRGDGEFERNVRFAAINGPYTFSLAEATKGVTLEYDLVVDRDFDGIMFFDPRDARGRNRGTHGLAVFEEITGNEQRYALDDCGLPVPQAPNFAGDESKPLRRGHYRYTMEWDGRNWTGTSCHGEPKGPPFPPGEYQLTLTASGIVEESDGARPFELKGTAPVLITP